MTGFYLSLNQGWTQYESVYGVRNGKVEIRENTKKAQSILSKISQYDLGVINLEASNRLAKGYELGNICSIYYEISNLPGESTIISDLMNLIEIYRELKQYIGKNILDIKGSGQKKDFQKETKRVKAIQGLKELYSGLDALTSTDLETVGFVRKEQGFLRKILFADKPTTKCGICNLELPTSMVVAAHIKKRSLCNHEERLDPNVVMPMCRFGCDELYEKGYISVYEGKIFLLCYYGKLNGSYILTRKTEKYLESIKDNEISNWDEVKTKHYFYDHMNFHIKEREQS
jgi:hypothetical protein